MTELESSLIDLKAEMANKAEGRADHRERLSERTPHEGDAIVRAASNMKMLRPTEMIGPCQSQTE